MSEQIKAVVVGSINTDLIASVARLPRTGETTLAERVDKRLGGKGANQAVALARLGAEVALVGAVGAGHGSAELLGELALQGVELDGVRTMGGPGGLAVVMVEANGNNCVLVAPGANACLDREHVEGALAERGSFDCVLLQMEIPLDTVAWTIRHMRDRTRWLILNAAPAHDLNPEVLALVDVLVVNEVEARQLTGSTDPLAAGRALAALVRHYAVVTLGGDGSVLVGRGLELKVEAVPVEVVDTTGAGDCFVAALALELARGAPPHEAMGFAAAAAALAVARVGGQEALPKYEEASAVYARQGDGKVLNRETVL